MGAELQAIQTLADLGATGILIYGIWAFISGTLRSGRLVDDQRTRDTAESTGWRAVAETAVAKLGDLTAAVVDLTRQVAELRAEIRRLREMVRDLGGKP